jgi:hypothetical protein
MLLHSLLSLFAYGVRQLFVFIALVIFIDFWRKAVRAIIPFCCLLGTIFLEFWKRKTAELAYQWDVSDFEEQVRICTSHKL